MPIAGMRRGQGRDHACKTAKTCRGAGLEVNFPHRQKRENPSSGTPMGMRCKGVHLLWLRAHRLAPVAVSSAHPSCRVLGNAEGL